jgi:hypothetical protein
VVPIMGGIGRRIAVWGWPQATTARSYPKPTQEKAGCGLTWYSLASAKAWVQTLVLLKKELWWWKWSTIAVHHCSHWPGTCGYWAMEIWLVWLRNWLFKLNLY